MLSRSVLVPPLTQPLLLARVTTLAGWHASVPRLSGLGVGVLFFIRWAIAICPIAKGTLVVGGARVGDRDGSQDAVEVHCLLTLPSICTCKGAHPWTEVRRRILLLWIHNKRFPTWVHLSLGIHSSACSVLLDILLII